MYSLGICLERTGKVDQALQKFNDGVMVDPNSQSKQQIQAHVNELQQQRSMISPGMLNPGGAIFSQNQAPGAGLFGVGNSFFTQPLSDLIKVNKKD